MSSHTTSTDAARKDATQAIAVPVEGCRGLTLTRVTMEGGRGQITEVDLYFVHHGDALALGRLVPGKRYDICEAKD